MGVWGNLGPFTPILPYPHTPIRKCGVIAIIDYGAGNRGRVSKAFRYLGAPIDLTKDAEVVRKADALVLPGVGAFGHCMSGLAGIGLTQATAEFIQSGRPFLGICVGLQMLFDMSEEMGSH